MNKAINYADLIERNKKIDDLNRIGMVIIPKKRLKTLGWACIVFGVLTLPIPFTTPIFVFVGLLLLGLSKQDLINKIKHKVFMFKYKGGIKYGRI